MGILDKINKYMEIQEKKDTISLSLNYSNNIEEIIEMVRKSDDKEKIISMFNEDIRKKLKSLEEGGLL